MSIWSVRTRVVAVFLTLAMGVAVSVSALTPSPARAVSGNEFDPGYIISDAAFYDRAAMSEAEIQAFLDARIGTCQNGQCLNVLRSNLASRARLVSDSTGQVRCGALSGGNNLSAAAIIYRTQIACGISAKVILVTLQKEQAIVTKNAPSRAALDRAMGFACPDTAPCAVDSLGFANQVYKGALQLMTYKAARFGRQPGTQFVQYNPNSGCGGTNVNVANYATAALYNYTPYQPNPAALGNLRGTGDTCSAYGNRNFWVFYNDWFGSPTGSINPIGNVDSVTATAGGVRVRGWTLDPDSTSPVEAHVYVDGVGTKLVANDARPDVERSYPGRGAAHGFDDVVPVRTSGNHEVCVFGINVGPGANTLLDCRTVSARGGNPFGAVDAVTAKAGSITVSGWVIDPDTAESTSVHLYVDSAGTSVPAARVRSDLARLFPLYGGAHGFSAAVPASTGSHRVCAYGINRANGTNTLLNCSTVVVPAGATEAGRAPFGAIDVVRGGLGELTVAGWAIDPDTAQSLDVHVYAKSGGSALRADQERSDIATKYVSYGGAHGFTATLPASPGVQTVCIYAINTGAGGNPVLGCRTVTVASAAPFGKLDSAVVSNGQLRVRGWAIDPRTSSPAAVHLYTGSAGTAIVADQSRPDVSRAYGLGDRHGFDRLIPLPTGENSVCAYAIGSGGSSNTLIGCSPIVR